MRKLKTLTLAQKASIADEIHSKQPNLLASCLVQAKLGADEQVSRMFSSKSNGLLNGHS